MGRSVRLFGWIKTGEGGQTGGMYPMILLKLLGWCFSFVIHQGLVGPDLESILSHSWACWHMQSFGLRVSR